MDTFDRLVAGIVAALVVAIGIVIGLGDRVGVTVVLVTPNGGQNPSSTTPIRLTFSQAMDTASVKERLSIRPQVAGTFRWEGSTLSFQPNQALAPDQIYTVTLEAGAQSLTNRQVAHTFTWSFVPRLPRIIYLAPANADIRSLWITSLDGSPPTEIYASTYGIDGFAPSPDGSHIAVTAYGTDQSADIWIIDALGKNPHHITDCQVDFCGAPAWSADGERLAFERRKLSSTGGSGPSRIWLYILSSGQSAPLYQDDQVLGSNPIWSPAGERLAFFDDSGRAIRVLDLSGGDTFRLPSLAGEVGSFSPDGEQMVFTDIRQVGGQFFPEILLADLSAQGGISALDAGAEADRFPAWSPDGKWIAFGRRSLSQAESSGIQLVITDPANGQTRQLTSDLGYNNSLFAWSPTSDHILLHRFDLKAAPGTLDLWVYNLEDDSLSLAVKNAFGGQWLP
jgi:Tol biopolymer transport system component